MSGQPAYHGWTHRPKEQGGTDPIDFPASGGGWPTMHNLLYGVQVNDRTQDTGLGINTKWRSFHDSTKWSTFKWQNSDDAGTTFYDASYCYWGMMLGPVGSAWGIYSVVDQRLDGGNATFTWATDPRTDGILSDATTLTYYGVPGNTLSMNGVAATFESGLQAPMRLNGAAGDMLSANGSSFDTDQTNAYSVNGGAGFWWLKVLTSDGDSGDFAVVFRDLRVIRLDINGAVN